MLGSSWFQSVDRTSLMQWKKRLQYRLLMLWCMTRALSKHCNKMSKLMALYFKYGRQFHLSWQYNIECMDAELQKRTAKASMAFGRLHQRLWSTPTMRSSRVKSKGNENAIWKTTETDPLLPTLWRVEKTRPHLPPQQRQNQETSDLVQIGSKNTTRGLDRGVQNPKRLGGHWGERASFFRDKTTHSKSDVTT